jgi:hypothetical protein
LTKKKKLVLVTAVVAMVVGITVPAAAQNVPNPPQTTVYVPEQTVGSLHVPQSGGTLSCSGTPYTAPSGTCTPLGNGMVAEGQLCDIPTTVTFFGSTQLSAFECHTPDITPASHDIVGGSGNDQFVVQDPSSQSGRITFR